MANAAIYDQLVHCRVIDATRRRVLQIIEELWDAGVGGVLLGCTELELLIKQADCELPVYPCTTLQSPRPSTARADSLLAGRPLRPGRPPA